MSLHSSRTRAKPDPNPGPNSDPHQVREYYSAVRLIAHALDLRSLYGLSDFDLREHWEAPAELSPLGFCDALALKKGYRIARGRGGADTHRAGLEVRRDCYAQPEP